MRSSTVIVALAAAPAFAAPALQARATTCPADIDNVFLSLVRPKDQVVASNFCSTYIRSIVTVTSTVQPQLSTLTTTLPQPTETVTLIVNQTELLSVTETITPDPSTTLVLESAATTLTDEAETSIIEATVTVSTTTNVQKRDAGATLPPFLTAFSSPQISSACSRIVSPAASTTTATITASRAVQTLTITPNGATATVMSTQIIPVVDHISTTLQQSIVTSYSTSFSTKTVPGTIITQTTTDYAVQTQVCNRATNPLWYGNPGAYSQLASTGFDASHGEQAIIQSCLSFCQSDNAASMAVEVGLDWSSQITGDISCLCYGATAANFQSIPGNLFSMWDLSCFNTS